MQYLGLLGPKLKISVVYTPGSGGGAMPTGLKETSSLIVISASVTQSALGAFTDEQVSLQLNPLDNEVFIIYGIDIDAQAPSLVPGAQTLVTASVSSTSRTTVGSLADNNVLASTRIDTQDSGVTAVTNQFSSDSAPGTQLDYIGILATNDFFVNIDAGANNLTPRFANARLWGVRAKASSSIYAALVQSELLSQ
jgi:hypothetical protein